MQFPFWSTAAKPSAGHSRRELLRRGSLATAALGLGGRIRRAVAAPVEYGVNLYRFIGVKTLINARGTFTIITGSQTLSEVKRAMDDASRAYVQMDELMDDVGRRLAELTGAEWGIVTAGFGNEHQSGLLTSWSFNSSTNTGPLPPFSKGGSDCFCISRARMTARQSLGHIGLGNG